MFWPKLAIDRPALDALTSRPFAHRGLHGGDIVENSVAAFDLAVERGFGIELDVRMTADEDVIVFHDAELERLTEATGAVARLGTGRLQAIKLKGCGETLQRLDDVLLRIHGRTPVLIEVKADGNRYVPACMAVRRALEGYKGSVGVMSFHPGVPAWFARHAPKVLRGLVMTEDDGAGRGFELRRRLRRQLLIARAQAQFIAFDIGRLPSPFVAAARRRGLRILTWTVRDAEAHAVAARCADQVIFEGDLPSSQVA